MTVAKRWSAYGISFGLRPASRDSVESKVERSSTGALSFFPSRGGFPNHYKVYRYTLECEYNLSDRIATTNKENENAAAAVAAESPLSDGGADNALYYYSSVGTVVGSIVYFRGE
jgi:hypothetical protein